MSRVLSRHLLFLLTLGPGLLAGALGAIPARLMGMPGTNWLGMDLVRFGPVPAGVLGAFGSVGRLAPLRTSLLRTAPAASATVGAFAALLRLAVQAPWLTGDDALLLTLAGMATLGFVTFLRGGEERGEWADV